MGHVHEDSLRKMADYYGLKSQGQFITCFECLLAKIRQRNVGKTTEKTSKIPGERLMVDISLVRSPSFGGSKFLIMVLDDCTFMCWSMFVLAKSYLPKYFALLIKKLQLDQRYLIKHIVKSIRCDDAGENKAWKNDAFKNNSASILSILDPEHHIQCLMRQDCRKICEKVCGQMRQNMPLKLKM
jgi:hypothetical protein